MTVHITGDPVIPDPEERANVETGFWDDQGRVALWPDDIDECTYNIPEHPGVGL